MSILRVSIFCKEEYIQFRDGSEMVNDNKNKEILFSVGQFAAHK